MNVCVIGCGAISGIYFENLARFGVPVVACADLDFEKAALAASKTPGARALSVEAALADPAVDFVLNLTVPLAHYSVSMRAIEAGKHVYVEKPLATTFEEGRRLMEAAESRGLTIGCAPDTVLGAGIQTCADLIREGALGTPIGVNAFMLCPGHESWHPSPEFYYERGGGPLFDMGPYYLTALVTMLGPISAVSGMASTPRAEREITSEPKRGKRVPVETPTHIAAQIEFANGVIASLTTSFDVQRTTLPPIEVYGTEGTVRVPDPNGFDGPIYVGDSKSDWRDVPITRPYRENSRGLGVWDQIQALQAGKQGRVSGAIGLHVLEAMELILVSSETGRCEPMTTRPPLMEAMPRS